MKFYNALQKIFDKTWEIMYIMFNKGHFVPFVNQRP